MSAPKRWTTREVADHFRVQPPTILRWVEEGKLRPASRRAIRKGKAHICLFDEAEVMAVDEQRAHEPADPIVAGDVAAIIDAELRIVRGERRGA